jgi:hypothetical protein
MVERKPVKSEFLLRVLYIDQDTLEATLKEVFVALDTPNWQNYIDGWTRLLIKDAQSEEDASQVLSISHLTTENILNRAAAKQRTARADILEFAKLVACCSQPKTKKTEEKKH